MINRVGLVPVEGRIRGKQDLAAASHVARAVPLPVPQTSAHGKAPGAVLPAARLAKVIGFIEENLDKPISLAELARTAGMSVYYFATLFKKSTGQSPHRYIVWRRVVRASELLRDTSLSILQVSLDLGFEHPNNFARAFRRVTGVSPTRFRQTQAMRIERPGRDAPSTDRLLAGRRKQFDRSSPDTARE